MRSDPVSFRISEEAHDSLRALAKRLGLSQASVVEMAVRMLDETLERGAEPSVTRRKKEEE